MFERFVYLASPYSHPDSSIVRQRFEQAAEATARLCDQGFLVFSPIVHSHPQVPYTSKASGKFADWETLDKAMIDRCDELFVLMLPGFDKSVGVEAEVVYAVENNKPVTYLAWPTLEERGKISTFQGDYNSEVADVFGPECFGGEDYLDAKAYTLGGFTKLTDADCKAPVFDFKEIEAFCEAHPNFKKTSLPESVEDRNQYPMAEGLLYYFPNALAEVSKISKFGNDQHNPGQDMHWSRGKSTDHANKIIRHLVDAGTTDSHGNRHSAFVAWRALALLQEELEQANNLPLPKNARFDV